MKRFVLAGAFAVAGQATMAADGTPTWPQFRGTVAAGTAEGNVPVQIGSDKNVKWKVAVPPGFSSPVVWNDKLFLTAFDANKLYTIAYDRGTGKELWRKEAPAKKIEAYHKTEGSPAASTVATDGEKVVAYFGSAGVFCYDFAGTEQWRYELPTAETGFDFGSGSSPVIADGKVILARDLKADQRLIALDLKSGSKVWEKPRVGFATGWSTPAIWDTPQGKQIALPGYGRMVGYDLATGDEKWSVAGMPSACCTTPVPVNGMLLFAGWSPGEDFKMPAFEKLIEGNDTDGDGKLSKAESEKSFIAGFFDNNDPNKDGVITKDEWEAAGKFMAKANNSAFLLKPGGSGDVSATHVVWKVKKGLPYVPTPLAYNGLVYTANMRGMVSAFDLKTGKDAYLEENVGLTGIYASPIAVNNHVYYFGLDGAVVVLKAGDIPEVAFRGKLGERVAATPAVAENTLYVRTAKHLYAFGK
jgi:outer membrane protein assembly factor BamB